MKHMNVENVSIRMIQLQNNLKNTSGKLKVQVDPSLRINKENHKRCLGSIECKIATVDDEEQENKDFELNLVVDGLYFSDEEIQSTTSVKRFIIISLFPYIQNFVATITTFSNMQSIILPYPPLDNID